METCAEWVVPYIGDLLGARGLLAAGEGPFSQRSRVANTMGYRRGKGTVAVLEQLARDVTGWPARAVELFERLATTQHVNHPRPFALATASLRNADALELLRGPFGSAPHIADVRHVDNRRGRHNIPHVGIFLWRLQSYAVTRSSARPAPGAAPALAGRYTFHPLGLEAPLYNLSRTETEISFLAGESNVPGPLRRRPVAGALEALRLAGADDPAGASYFGTDPVLEVFVQREPGGPMRAVPPAELLVCDLSDAPDAGIESDWRRPQPVRDYPPEQGGPRPITAAVDPVTGRLAFPAGVSPQRVEVSYAYGFAGDLGGGPYDRRAAVQALVPDPGEVGFQLGVTRDAPAGHPHLVPDLGTAVRAWNARPAGTVGVIALMDSRSYSESLSGENAITIPAGSRLAIVAADWPAEEPLDPQTGVPLRTPGRLVAVGRRPHLRGEIAVRGTAPAGSTDPGVLAIDGLLLEGSLTVLPGNLGALRLSHSTLAPRRQLLPPPPVTDPPTPPVAPPPAGRLIVQEAPAGAPAGQQNERLLVSLERCITGPLEVAGPVDRLRVVGSVIDGQGRPALTGPRAEVRESTILGRTLVRSLEASNTIFFGSGRRLAAPGGLRALLLPPPQLACGPALPLPAGRRRRRPPRLPPVRLPALRGPGLRPAGPRLSGADRAGGGRRGRDGGLPLSAAGSQGEQPAGQPGRVPAPGPGGRDLLRDLSAQRSEPRTSNSTSLWGTRHERGLHPPHLPPGAALQRGAPATGPRPAGRGLERAGGHRRSPRPDGRR